jgi:hypothetical protein
MILRLALAVAVTLMISPTETWSQTKPTTATTVPARPGTAPAATPSAAPAAQPASWDGRWSGSFGARSDIVVQIAAGKVTSVTLLGQPLTIASNSVSDGSATVSGPDFSLSLTRVAPTSAQGTYVNNRNEKATALLSRN